MRVKLAYTESYKFDLKKLQIVKGIKWITSWGLKESKDFFDKLHDSKSVTSESFELDFSSIADGELSISGLNAKYFADTGMELIGMESRDLKLTRASSKCIIYDIRGFAYYIVEGDYSISENNLCTINMVEGYRGMVDDELNNSSSEEVFSNPITDRKITLPFSSLIIEETHSSD